MLLPCYCCCCLHFYIGGSAAPEHGEITSLPGYNGQLRSRHFGGYIKVDEEHDRNLYYYMVSGPQHAAAVQAQADTHMRQHNMWVMQTACTVVTRYTRSIMQAAFPRRSLVRACAWLVQCKLLRAVS